MRLVAVCFALSAACQGTSKLSAERDRLSAQKARLEASLTEALGERWAAPSEMDAGLVLAVPNSLAEDVLSQTLAEGVNGVSLRIKNLAVHVEDELKVKLLVAKLTVGAFDLEVLLLDATGQVEAGPSRASVADGRIRLEAPLRIVGGRGRARIRLRWKGLGLARAVCGDLDVTREVDGAIAPLEISFQGSAFPKVERSEFVIQPDLPAQHFELVIEPSKESWAQVEEIVSQRGRACRFALGELHVVEQLGALLAKGIRVTIHTERLKTLRLPLAITKRSTIDGRSLTFTAAPESLIIGRDYTWFGSSFRVSARGDTDR